MGNTGRLRSDGSKRNVRALLAIVALATGSFVASGVVPVAAANRAAVTAERGTAREELRAALSSRRAPVAVPAKASAAAASALTSCQGTWSVVPSANTAGPNDMNAVAAVSANDIWTAGRSILGSGVAQTLTEHWNGNAWSVVPSPNTNAGTGDNIFSSIAATSTTDVWAVGSSRFDQTSARSSLTEHWNGSNWTIVASPNVTGESTSLFAVKGDAPNDYWAVGRSRTAGATADHNLVEHWDGTSWTISPAAASPYTFSELTAVKVLSPMNVWAVGTQTNDKLNYYPLIQHWDGTGWSVVPSALSTYGNGGLLGIDGTANDLWAVGFGQSTGWDATFIEHWNGTAWSNITNPPTGANTDLNSVVALSTTNVWAVGADYLGTAQAPTDQTFVTHWDGSNWSRVPSPNAGSAADLFDVTAVSATDIWAVGLYLSGGIERTLSENYCVPPTVTGIAPTTGPATGGTNVTITGTGLKWTSGVNFAGAAATNVTVVSDTQVTATSPSGRAGIADVRIVYFAGQTAISAADQFTYVATVPGAPTNVIAIAGDGSATVFWFPPAWDGGTGLTQYTIVPTSGGVAGAPIFVNGTPPTTNFTLTGLINGTAYTFTVSATNSAGTGPPSAASDPVTPGRGAFHALVPCRILDTRSALGGHQGLLGQGVAINVQVAGAVDQNGSPCGVPSSGASAVILNVTVTDTTAASFLTISPAGIPQPVASSLNWTAGKTVPNLVVAALGKGGQLTVFNAAGGTNVIIDVAGYVSLPTAVAGVNGLYNPVVPFRVLDTRGPNGGHDGPVGQAETMNLQVGGRTASNIPATGVSAVVLNVTVTGATAGSYLTVFPMGAAQPVASNLNFVAGQTVPNRVIVKVGTNAGLGTSGWVSIYNAAGSVHVIVDVAGWFTDGTDAAATGSLFVGIPPTRRMDTRNGHGPVGAGATMTLTIAGSSGVPSTATAVVLNVTVTNATAASYLTVWPAGAPQPNASDLNYTAGLTVPNLVIVKVGSAGQVNFFNAAGSTDVIVDVVGWYG